VLCFPEFCRHAPASISGVPSLIKAVPGCTRRTCVCALNLIAARRSVIPRKEVHVVTRPAGTNAFEFVVVSALRAAQLMKGCTPRVPPGYKPIVTAQLEVAAGLVSKIVEAPKAEGV
jgi:DNA-directed RNA polymerase subunit K/omega